MVSLSGSAGSFVDAVPAASQRPVRPGVMTSDRMPKRLPSWANKAAVRELRRAAVLSLEFDGADDLAALIGDARRLLAFLLAAPSRKAANMRLEIFSRTPGRCWRCRIALAAELCRYIEERRAA